MLLYPLTSGFLFSRGSSRNSLAGREVIAVTRIRACGRSSPQLTRRAWTKPRIASAPTGPHICLLLPQARGTEKWSCHPTRHSALQEARVGTQAQKVDFRMWVHHSSRSPSPLLTDGTGGLGLARGKLLPHSGSLVPWNIRAGMPPCPQTLCSSSPAGLTRPSAPRLKGPDEKYDGNASLGRQ